MTDRADILIRCLRLEARVWALEKTLRWYRARAKRR
jgi:hypothetical protein